MSAAIISPKSFQEPGGCIPGKVILRTLFCFCVGISPTKWLFCFKRRFSRRLSTRRKGNRNTGRNEKNGSCSSDSYLLGKYHWNRLPLSMFCPPFVCDNCERFVSILLVYPYLSAMALCSGHSAHRQLQCCSKKASLSCLPVNIIVTDTPAIPSHRMNNPSVALKNGHPTSTLSQLVAIDYPPKLLAFCYAFACTIMHPLARF